MTVLSEGQTPKGVMVRQEDWSDTYRFDIAFARDIVATFPVANNIIEDCPFTPLLGQPYRLSFFFGTRAEADKAFEALVSGSKTITDFEAQAVNPMMMKAL